LIGETVINNDLLAHPALAPANKEIILFDRMPFLITHFRSGIMARFPLAFALFFMAFLPYA